VLFFTTAQLKNKTQIDLPQTNVVISSCTKLD